MKAQSIIALLCIAGLAVWAPLWYMGRVADIELENALRIEKTAVDPATVAAYEKMGAIHGAWGAGDGGLHWGHYGTKVPGFEFKTFPAAKLPGVDVPFGLNLSGATVTAADLRMLAHLKTLVLIDFDRAQITDAHLRALREIGLLHALNAASANSDPHPSEYTRPNSAQEVCGYSLYGTQVTDAGLKELAPLRNLVWLSLAHTKAGDAGLRDMPAFPKLATLSLTGTKVTDAGLRNLPVLPSLAELDLDETQVTDAGLRELARFPGLAKLNLAKTQVTSAGLKELAPLKNLCVLDLQGTKLTDDSLRHLAPFKKLARLQVSFPIGDAGLRSMRKIDLLHALPMANLGATGRAESAEQVTTLFLGGAVTDAGLKELFPLKNVDWLNLNGSFTNAGLRELAPLQKIKWLDIRCPRVTDAGLKELVVLTNLENLGIEDAPITGSGLEDLAPLAKLYYLSLTKTGVDDDGLRSVASLKALKTLNLLDPKADITDAGLMELAVLRNLTYLYLKGTKVTPAGLAELKKALPQCEMHRY
jgi:Leucine-rich repeat (LRR) protein